MTEKIWNISDRVNFAICCDFNTFVSNSIGVNYDDERINIFFQILALKLTLSIMYKKKNEDPYGFMDEDEEEE